MDTQSSPVRIRLTFTDPSILSHSQRSQGMNNTWLLIEPQQHHRTIADVINHILHFFNLHASCPNGLLLSMEGYVLPPSESTRILKDNDIICVKRKVMALTEAIEREVNRREAVDNGVLLLANGEFDKENGGYQSESEEEISEEEPSPKETASKKRKASTKLGSSKKKKKRSVVMDDHEDKEDETTNNNGECHATKIISKKTKPNKEKRSGESEIIIAKVNSPSKVKRKKKHRSEVLSGAEDEAVEDEIDHAINGESLHKKITSKKKSKRNEETNKENAETLDENVKDNVKGVEQASTTPDESKKGPSRSSRRKKAKRQWRRELANVSQNEPETHLEPEVSEAEKKEADGHPEGLLKQDQVPTKNVRKNVTEKEERKRNGNVETELVPCVVRPGHIRFEPLDEDEDNKQTAVSDVSFQWNGITSKKKGQKWGLEKTPTFQRDAYQDAIVEASSMLTELPVVDLNDFDKLPLYSSPKEGDVIAYRVLELTSSWTPELTSFRVGKVSHYDGNIVVLMPVPEYPIVLDKMDEDTPDDSLYKEDGSLEIKFAALVDVRCVKQSNSDAMPAVTNGVDQTLRVDGKETASSLISSSNKKSNLPKDPSPVVTNKGGNTWNEVAEALRAKKLELLETMSEETKRDSEWNKWSLRALKSSALGPTMALLRSGNI
ncbi:Coilin [Artemisia annua]|uniref:Coilin n=1 Tax=Artemisia annua TaxID=35608 RepID=A0A2U1N616_ARTAN|nr:Coilin [Artemisia annua]